MQQNELTKSVTVGRSTKRSNDSWKERDEWSYQGINIPSDPAKRFLVNGLVDSRHIKEIVSLNDKEVYFPKKVDNVGSDVIDRLSRSSE